MVVNLPMFYSKCIPVHVFRNLFWKICHLFRQILIACLKCPRASFSPFSYSENMRWGRGWSKSSSLKMLLEIGSLILIFFSLIGSSIHRKTLALGPSELRIFRRDTPTQVFAVDTKKFLRIDFSKNNSGGCLW